MIPVMHRVNTTEALKNISGDFGVEADLRSSGKDIILHHDAFTPGEKLEDFVSHYSHEFFIVDIKSEGIEMCVIDVLEAAGIEDFYLLNVNFPFILKLANSGFSKLSVRFSEFESLDSCLSMKGKVDFVWVESFDRFTLTKDVYDVLSKHFKISLVSPELYKRNEIENYRKLLAGMNIHNVCTDYPERWV